MSNNGRGRGRSEILKLLDSFRENRESAERSNVAETTVHRSATDLPLSMGRGGFMQSINSNTGITGRSGIVHPTSLCKTQLDINTTGTDVNTTGTDLPSNLTSGKVVKINFSNPSLPFGRGSTSGFEETSGIGAQIQTKTVINAPPSCAASTSSQHSTLKPSCTSPIQRAFIAYGPSQSCSEHIDRASVTSMGIKDVTNSLSNLEILGESESTLPEAIIKKGTSGHIVDVAVNYIRLHKLKNYSMFSYHVIFLPPIENKVFRKQIVRSLQDTFGGTLLFDGATMFLPLKLPEKETKCSAKHPSTGELIEITIRFIKEKTAFEKVTVYNILFKKVMSVLKYVRLKTHNYNPELQYMIPQHKLTLWPGFVTTVSEVEDGVMLTVDPLNKILRVCSVLEEIRELMNISSSSEELIKKAIIGRTVITSYNYKAYVVTDVKFDLTPMSKFKWRSGEEITYVEYYKNTYLKKIDDLHQPMLISSIRRRLPNSNEKEEEIVCLVPELCNFTGLTDKMKKDFTMMKDLASHTRITPNQRSLMLQKYINNLNKSPEATKVLTDWGISIDKGPVKLQARTLLPETILFKNYKHAQNNYDVSWSKETTLYPVIHPVDIDNWIIIYSRRNGKTTREFLDIFNRCGPTIGINVTSPRMEQIDTDQPGTFVMALKKAIPTGIRMAMCIIPPNREDIYAAIKRVCYVENALPSQIVTGLTLSKVNKLRNVAHKILLQMVCKLGGTLWSVPIPYSSVMVIGMDVYHSIGKKSVCGFVASYDKEVTRWYSRVCFQSYSQETVDQLQRCMIETLMMYYSQNECYPQRIVIYRDGISTNDISMHMDYELEQFKRAFKDISYDYNPYLSLVIVQKRINTRIFSVIKGEYDNPKPGTIVDHTITNKYLYDFFLVSQKVHLASLIPTHYIVMYDNSNMSPDHMQRFTFKMCHLYYNWCGTVRVPAPCQYAHKLAFMVGSYLLKEHHKDLSKTLFFL